MSGELSATTSTPSGSVPFLKNGVKLAREILDVVVDGDETVSTGLDEEVVERHVESACRGGPSQATGSYLHR